MDKKQRLMKLYEAEIQKISEIREDMDSLAEMSDDQLIVLVEKAGKCSRIQQKAWEQICGNDIARKDVSTILEHRSEMKKDLDHMKQLEMETDILTKEIKEQKEILKQYKNEQRKEKISIRNKWVLAISFGIMFLCAVLFHIAMFKIYHTLLIPSFILLGGIPLAGAMIFSYSLRQDLREEEDEVEEEILQSEIDEKMEKMKEDQEMLQFYEDKYKSVFDEMDDYMWDAYPYVEKILKKLDYREDYQKARNEYEGIMEILHFRHPEVYLYFPEIFLVEKEQDEFLQKMQKRMEKIDEYLVQTMETA